jgi:hypothetical protein
VEGSALAGIKRLRALSNSFDNNTNNGTSDQKYSAARELFSHLGHSNEKPNSEAIDPEYKCSEAERKDLFPEGDKVNDN